jgi:hypothetical protein
MSFGAGGDTAQFIDFASVSSGASASLQYRPANAANTSGTLTVTDGAHSASVLLVGNYTSNSFVTSAAGDGSPEVFDPPVATVHSANVALLVNYMAATLITPGRRLRQAVASQRGAISGPPNAPQSKARLTSRLPLFA